VKIDRPLHPSQPFLFPAVLLFSTLFANGAQGRIGLSTCPTMLNGMAYAELSSHFLMLPSACMVPYGFSQKSSLID